VAACHVVWECVEEQCLGVRQSVPNYKKELFSEM